MPILQSPGGLWSFEACNCSSKFQIKLIKLVPNFRRHAMRRPHRPRWMHLVWRSATMRCSAKTSMLFSDRCVRVPPLDLKCCLDASETAETESRWISWRFSCWLAGSCWVRDFCEVYLWSCPGLRKFSHKQRKIAKSDSKLGI